jgi:nicotinamidase-related amidase
MTTRDLGVFTNENSALVLIDYQKEMFETIRSETTAQLAELHVRLLARIAKALEMPIVLSTVGVNYKINSPTQPAILADLPGVTALDRTSMNAFEDRAFVDAVKKTGRTRLIVGGLHTEICLTFAMIEALKAGYDGMFVTDAVGGRSQVAHKTAIERMTHAGAVPTTALSVVTELFRDWASPLMPKAREVIYWYFSEVSKLKADVGVSEVEKKEAAKVLAGA